MIFFFSEDVGWRGCVRIWVISSGHSSQVVPIATGHESLSLDTKEYFGEHLGGVRVRR